MKKNAIIVSVSVIVLLVGMIGFVEESRSAEKKNARIRVGIYDSRAVAVAYAHSDYFRKTLHDKYQELEKAISADDTEKVNALEAWGRESSVLIEVTHGYTGKGKALAESKHKKPLQDSDSIPDRIRLEPNLYNKLQKISSSFGSVPVRDLLEPVKDSLPKIAKSCGVDIIVSQCLIDYQAPNAELVDITDEMIEPFKPNERVLEIVEFLKKMPPLSEAEIKKHDH